MCQTGTKNSPTDVPLTYLDNRWAGTFSPGWSYQPGLKVSLVPGAKNTGTKAKFQSGSNVVSLLVEAEKELIARALCLIKIFIRITFIRYHIWLVCLFENSLFVFAKLRMIGG